MEIFYFNKLHFRKESDWLKVILNQAKKLYRTDWVVVATRVKTEKKKPLKYILENKRNKTKCEIEYDGKSILVSFYKREMPDISRTLIPDWFRFKEMKFLEYFQDSSDLREVNLKIIGALFEHLGQHTPYSLGKQERIKVSEHKDLLCKKIQHASHEENKIFVTFDDNTSIEIPTLPHLEIKPSNCLLFKKELGYRTVCQMECAHFYNV